MSTRISFHSGQSSPHPLLGDKWTAHSAIMRGSGIFNVPVHHVSHDVSVRNRNLRMWWTPCNDFDSLDWNIYLHEGCNYSNNTNDLYTDFIKQKVISTNLAHEILIQLIHFHAKFKHGLKSAIHKMFKKRKKKHKFNLPSSSDVCFLKMLALSCLNFLCDPTAREIMLSAWSTKMLSTHNNKVHNISIFMYMTVCAPKTQWDEVSLKYITVNTSHYIYQKVDILFKLTWISIAAGCLLLAKCFCLCCCCTCKAKPEPRIPYNIRNTPNRCKTCQTTLKW